MVISIIVAMDENRGIGIEGRLPWRLSNDLKRFKRLTMGHHLIMGRKTYASIGHPLPGRDTIILTRNPQFEAEGCQTASTLADAIQIAASRDEDEIFVCGGAEVYAQALPIADRIYLTQVHAKTSANVHFPPLGTQTWSEKSSPQHPADENNQYPFTYKILTVLKSRDGM